MTSRASISMMGRSLNLTLASKRVAQKFWKHSCLLEPSSSTLQSTCLPKSPSGGCNSFLLATNDVDGVFLGVAWLNLARRSWSSRRFPCSLRELLSTRNLIVPRVARPFSSATMPKMIATTRTKRRRRQPLSSCARSFPRRCVFWTLHRPAVVPHRTSDRAMHSQPYRL